MAVYVDNYRERRRMGEKGIWVFSHLIADTREELDEMAEWIGLDFKWKQKAGEITEHYDVTENYRMRAIRLGAKPITYTVLMKLLRHRNFREYVEGRR